MLKFYDFLFYLIYRFYSRKEKGAASSAAGIIGGLQAANVLFVFMFFLFCTQRTEYLGKLGVAFTVIVFLFFQVTTYIRYIYKENNSVEKMEERWSALSESQQGKFRLLNLIYISLSLILLIGFGIFLGSAK